MLKRNKFRLLTLLIILILAHLYLLFMLLDWTARNWSPERRAGARSASIVMLALSVALQFVSALLLESSLAKSGVQTLRLSGTPIKLTERSWLWRYYLSFVASVACTFVVSMLLYFAAAIVPGWAYLMDSIATWLQSSFQ